jgi:hypothetical protein
MGDNAEEAGAVYPKSERKMAFLAGLWAFIGGDNYSER